MLRLRIAIMIMMVFYRGARDDSIKQYNQGQDSYDTANQGPLTGMHSNA
jgi:hypothetical protein